MAETSLKQMPSFSAEDEPQNTPGKGEKSKKREASSPLMVQDMQPEKKNRHGSGSSVSTESSASAFQDVAETDDTSSVRLYTFSQIQLILQIFCRLLVNLDRLCYMRLVP